MGLLRMRSTVVGVGLLIAGLSLSGCSGRDDPPAGVDAGPARDAGGGALDGGGSTDAAAPADASVAPDAGPRADGGVTGDGGGGTGDGGGSRDAGGGAIDGGPAAPCAAQSARGEGACDAFFGYYWDGSSCYGVSGCSCVGTDCGSGWASDTECATAHAGCAPADCRSPGMSCPAGQSCEACLGIGGVLYVCLPAGSVC